MRIIVTGGAGFIGSNLVDLLIEKNHEVFIIDNLVTGKIEYVNKKSKFYKIDIIDIEKLKLIFENEKPEIVYHFAAQIDVQTSLKVPALDAKVNIIGTINVLECCIEYGVKKIIYPSSAAVYGNPEYLPIDEKHKIDPISCYGISKHTPEHYIRLYSKSYGIKYTILRYANVYGIRQDPKGEAGVISIFIDNFIKGKSPIIFGSGEQTRDFIYIKDVVNANLLALTNGNNEVVNISTNKPTTINKLYEIIEKTFNIKLKVTHMHSREGDILHSYLDNEKASEKLKWTSKYSLENGVKETVKYFIGMCQQNNI